MTKYNDKFTPEFFERMLEEDESIYQAAKRHGCDSSAIRYHAKKHGYLKRLQGMKIKRRYTKKSIVMSADQLKECHAKGMRIKAIHQKHKISYTNIHKSIFLHQLHHLFPEILVDHPYDLLTKAQLERYERDGYTMNEVSERESMPISVVRDLCNRFNLYRDRVAGPRRQYDDILTLEYFNECFENDMTITDIARDIDIGMPTIRKYMRDTGFDKKLISHQDQRRKKVREALTYDYFLTCGNNGITKADIAKRFHIDPAFVKECADSVGYSFRKCVTKEQLEHFAELGYTYKEAGRAIGIRTRSIRVRCRQFGISLKNDTRNQKNIDFLFPNRKGFK